MNMIVTTEKLKYGITNRKLSYNRNTNTNIMKELKKMMMNEHDIENET